jgi:hypothetical protein
MKNQTELQTWADSLDKQPRKWNMDMRFGLWNVRSLYRAGSIITVLRELARYKLDLVGVHEVRREGGDRTCKRIYIFLWKGERVEDLTYNTNRSLGSYHCSACPCPNRR